MNVKVEDERVNVCCSYPFASCKSPTCAVSAGVLVDSCKRGRMFLSVNKHEHARDMNVG